MSPVLHSKRPYLKRYNPLHLRILDGGGGGASLDKYDHRGYKTQGTQGVNMNLNMIIAVGKDGVIGASDKGGGMPWSCPEDMKRFARLTKGDGNNIVLMGRTTSMLIKRPLPHRVNAVLSRAPGLRMSGYEVYGSLEGFLDHIKERKIDSSRVWVIGGAQVYNALFEISSSRKINIDMHISWITGDHEGDVTMTPDKLMPKTLYKTQVVHTEICSSHVYQHVKRFA